MANYGASSVSFVHVDGYDITTLLPDGLNDEGIEVALDEIRSVGDSYSRPASTGFTTALALTMGALYDDAVGATKDVFISTLGAFRVIVWCVSTNVIGKRFQGYAGQCATKIQRICEIKKLHRIKATFQASGPSEEGVILHALGAETAAGNTQATSVDWSLDTRTKVGVIVSTSVANPTVVTTAAPHGLVTGQKIVIAGDNSTPALNGAQTVTVVTATTFTVPVNVTNAGTAGTFVHANTIGGAAGYVSCSALTLGGYDDATVKIQHSQDNVTFVDLLTFTAITAAPHAERKVVQGTIHRYTASAIAFTGSGSSPSATFMVGLHRRADE